MKVSINGELFDYSTECSVAEALAIEEVYERRYVQWRTDLATGSAKAYCALAWLIWRRNGRDVDFKGIVSGDVEFNLDEMVISILEGDLAEIAAQEQAAREAAEEENPTRTSSVPAGTPTTGTASSPSSPASSGSGRGKSASSRSKTSKHSSTTPKNT